MTAVSAAAWASASAFAAASAAAVASAAGFEIECETTGGVSVVVGTEAGGLSHCFCSYSHGQSSD